MFQSAMSPALSIGQRDLQRHDSCNPGRNTGTYVWTWGTTTNQNFTLIIPAFSTPRPASQAQLLNLSTRMDVKTGE